jgi:hypothetical protein
MTTGLYAAYVTVTKVEMVASMVCVMEHDEKGGDLSVYRCKITIKKDKPFDEKIGGLQERRPAKCTVLFLGCGRLLAAAGCCWQVLSCDAVAFVPSTTSKSIGSFSEVAGVANNWCGVQGIQSIDVGVATTASVVSTGAATAVAATSTVATGVAAANTSTGVPVASSTAVANTTTTYSTAPACVPALPCPLELKLEL